MAKQVIKLTEQDLHRIVKESVERILNEEVNEGQGWDAFKHHMKFGSMPGHYSNDFDEKQWIETGNGYKPNSYQGKRTSANYYDRRNGDAAEAYRSNSGDYDRGMAANADNPNVKPINKGFTGRLGRKAALYGLKAMNKMGFKQ